MTLSEFFDANRKVAIAFSGGVDSAYLLYEAVKHNVEVTAYYVRSAFQPAFEYEDAKRLAKELGAKMSVLEMDILQNKEVCSNPQNRCYFCKKVIFKAITEAAAGDGYTVLLEGTNASDDEADRPGMKALRELSVKSPLRECGLTKTQIRQLSKEAGLFTWDKPSYACLATRIPAGEEIDAEKLVRTEQAEMYMREIGFVDFRVRTANDIAKIQIRREQFDLLFEKRDEITETLLGWYSQVTLDLKPRE